MNIDTELKQFVYDLLCCILDEIHIDKEMMNEIYEKYPKIIDVLSYISNDIYVNEIIEIN